MSTRMLTVARASRELGLSTYVTRKMIDKRELPTVLVNGRQRVLPETIEAIRSRGLPTMAPSTHAA